MPKFPFQVPILFSGALALLAGCSESAGFNTPTPRVLPHRVQLPGLPTLRVGEKLRNWPYPRKRLDELSMFWIYSDSSEVFEVPLSPRDSLERVWVTRRSGRVKCVITQRNQTYAAALDSLTRILAGVAPVWTDSSSTGKQVVWADGHVTWWLGGHWHPEVRPVWISVQSVAVVGRPFDSSRLEPC